MSTARRIDPPRRQTPVSSEILDRQPPVDTDAEMGVLGSILLRPDVCDDVAMEVRPVLDAIGTDLQDGRVG